MRTLLSDSSPANLFPVPSKQSTNCFGIGAGPNGAVSIASTLLAQVKRKKENLKKVIIENKRKHGRK